MNKSNLLRVLCILVTSVVLICLPESCFAAGGHGGSGGGGFHGGGGFGGGFHGAGFGGYHGGWGGAGWHGGWGGYGWRGWGYPGWGVGFGWGWGSYWAGYPYAYGYPYYYPYYPYAYGYPYYPYRPYYGPGADAPPNPDPYDGGNRDRRDNSQRQNSSYPGPRSPSVNDIPPMKFVSHKTAGDTDSPKYWLSNYQQHTVPRQEVRNVIQALLAMPPEARRRQIESGRYRNFSPGEQELLNHVAQVSPRGEPQKNADETTPAALRLASQQVQ